MKKARHILFLIAMGVSHGGAIADEMIPMLDSSNKSMYFQSIRCSALFSATARWGGKEQLGEKIFNGFFNQAENLFTFAIISGVSEGIGDVNAMQKMADADLVAIGQEYLDRFRSRYAKTGSAMDGDSLYDSDLAMCVELGRGVNQVLQEK